MPATSRYPQIPGPIFTALLLFGVRFSTQQTTPAPVLDFASILELYRLPEDAVLCDISGNDAEYKEEIIEGMDSKYGSDVTVRRIQSNGCPNHESVCHKSDECLANCQCLNNNTVSAVQNYTMDVPAFPCFAEQEFNVSCSPSSGLGMFLNGVPLYAPWAADPCVDAVESEHDGFDPCSGHATPNGLYHYHLLPSCLLDQLDDAVTTNPNGRSPRIGWALDGFPIYGPHGSDGEYIYQCTHPLANQAECLDHCNGLEGDIGDGFLYRYHATGPVGDVESNPLHPWPAKDMFPYVMGCLKGVPLDLETTRDIDQAEGLVCLADKPAVTADYQPLAFDGLTTLYDKRWRAPLPKTPTPTDGVIDDQQSEAHFIANAHFICFVCLLFFFVTTL